MHPAGGDGAFRCSSCRWWTPRPCAAMGRGSAIAVLSERIAATLPGRSLRVGLASGSVPGTQADWHLEVHDLG